MADSITVNGRTTYLPGVISTVDASALAGLGPAPRGYIGLIGAWPCGGAPKTAQILTSAGALKYLLPARDAAIISKLAFAPSTDPRIPGGAARIVLVRGNNATQGAKAFSKSAVDQVLFASRDYGGYVNNIAAKIENVGTMTAGRKVTITLGDATEVFDNLGDWGVFSATYTGGEAATMVCTVDPTDATNIVVVAYSVTKLQAAFPYLPSAMAFDGKVKIAIPAQSIPSGTPSRAFVITGVLKVAYGGKAAGATDTETLTVTSGGDATTLRDWSEITSIALTGGVLDGTATITGNAFALPKATYDTVSKVVDRINTKTAKGFVATRVTTQTGFAMARMDKTTAASIAALTPVFTANLDILITTVANKSALVTASRVSGATGLPDAAGPSLLVGGADGEMGASDIDDCLTVLEKQFVNHVVVLTDQYLAGECDVGAVHKAVVTHCEYMAGPGRDERNGWCGIPTGQTKANLKEWRRDNGNSRHVAFLPQSLTIYDDTGSKVTLDPCYTALLAAACDAGRGDGEGLAWRYVDVLGITDEPNQWSVADNADELVENGLMLLENDLRGIRWIRDVTTYGIDNNPVFCSVVANESLNNSTKNVRRALETVIGKSNWSGTRAIVKSLVLAELDRQVAAREIKAYDRNSVEIVDGGNSFDVGYKVAVIESIYWVRHNVHVVRIATAA